MSRAGGGSRAPEPAALRRPGSKAACRRSAPSDCRAPIGPWRRGSPRWRSPGAAAGRRCRASSSASGMFGSVANTSSPAAPSRPATRASTRAGSSITEPRATLISQPSGPSASITARLTRPAVVGPPRQVTIRQSTAFAISTRSGKILVSHIRLAVRAVVAERHVEGLGAPRHRPPDPAEAEDAQALAGERVGEHRVALLGPAPGAHVAVVAGDPARDVEQERHAELGHAGGQHVRGVGDPDAAGARGLKVDRIGPDPIDADDLDLGQVVEQRLAGADDAVGEDPPHPGRDLADVRVGIRRAPELAQRERLVRLAPGSWA